MRMKAAVLTAFNLPFWEREPTANDLAVGWTQGAGDGDGDWWDELVVRTEAGWWTGPVTVAPISSAMDNIATAPPNAASVRLNARMRTFIGTVDMKFQVKEGAITRYTGPNQTITDSWATYTIVADLSSVVSWASVIKLMVSSVLGTTAVHVAWYYMEAGP